MANGTTILSEGVVSGLKALMGADELAKVVELLPRVKGFVVLAFNMESEANALMELLKGEKKNE